jgi:hypothetical protein
MASSGCFSFLIRWHVTALFSDASMNPSRSLVPALVSGVIDNLWLYWTAHYSLEVPALHFLFAGSSENKDKAATTKVSV